MSSLKEWFLSIIYNVKCFSKCEIWLVLNHFFKSFLDSTSVINTTSRSSRKCQSSNQNFSMLENEPGLTSPSESESGEETSTDDDSSSDESEFRYIA